MTPMLRRLALVHVIAGLIIPIAAVSTAEAASDCTDGGFTCSVDNRGSDVHASVEAHSGHTASAGCQECRWAVVPACSGNSPGGANDALCTRATQCETGVLYDVFLWASPGPWREVGVQCLGGDTGQAARLAAGLRAEAERRFGAGQPSHQPTTGAVINMPVLFAAGQPATRTYQLTLLGQHLTLTGTATWHWDFGDGTTLTTTNPGGAYPNTSLAHTYTHPGTYTVRVTTTWQATYAFNTTRPQPVPGPPLQASAAPLTLTINQARSQLTG